MGEIPLNMNVHCSFPAKYQPKAMQKPGNARGNRRLREAAPGGLPRSS